MKNLKYLLLTLLIALTASCTDSPDSLSSRQITNKCKKELSLKCLDKMYATIKTGYYELNDLESRQQLMKLQAAGVITYSVKRYAWYTSRNYTKSVFSHNENYYWIYSGDFAYSVPVYKNKNFTTYDYEEHFLVKVALTEEGKKLQVDSLPTPQQEVDEDLKAPEVDASQFPENSISLEEKWPEIPYPGTKAGSKQSAAAAPAKTKTGDKPAKPAKKVDKWANAVDKKTAKAYYTEVEKAKVEPVYLKAFNVEVKKARNIRIINGEKGTYATAEIIFNYVDVTSLGRIIYGVNEKQPFSADAALIYYEDKGWDLNSQSFSLH